MPAVARAAQYAFAHAGVARTSRALAQLNQKGGIDCMSCAWPEPDGDRRFAEFCENGGKGTVKLDDFANAQAIFILGQNPGTNHPRMLTTLEVAKKAGAKIVAINPLPEAGLLGFMNPQKPLGMLGKATPLADQFLQIKIN